MSESQSPDEAVSFNYKELDMIGKGMYRSILNVVCCMNDVRTLAGSANTLFTSYLHLFIEY